MHKVNKTLFLFFLIDLTDKSCSKNNDIKLYMYIKYIYLGRYSYMLMMLA